MEIQKKAAEPEKKKLTRGAFVRYGSMAAAILLVCGGLLGAAIERGRTKSSAADAGMQAASASVPAEASFETEAVPEERNEISFDTDTSAATSAASAGSVGMAAQAAEKAVPEQVTSYDALYDLVLGMDNYYGAEKLAVAGGGMAESAAGEDGASMDMAVSSGSSASRSETFAMTEAAAADTGASGNAMGSYSETNVQVAGVDEADIVKTDGKYIYYITGDQLVIVEAAGQDTELVSKTEYLKNDEGWWGYASEMFLLGDRLMIITQSQDVVWAGSGINRHENYQARTLSLVYDVTNRAQPKLVSTLGQSGDYVSSRLVENYVYVVTSQYISSILRDEPRTFAPSLSANGTVSAMPVDSIYLYENANTPIYTVVSAFDLATGSQQASSRAVLGRGGEIYCSGKNLLIAANDYVEDVSPITPGADGRNVQVTTSCNNTRLMLFSLDGAKIEKTASGTVPGMLVNQFAMDEFNGAFRIVTTVNEWTQYVYTDGVDSYDYKDTTYNCLYTLAPDLQILGKLENLAEDEWVQSVRFDGDIAYFVTFKQVDPLFTVDVSDPKNPELLSALKIPGFSEYLHVFTDGRLLGIGYDADEETGRQKGVKMTMFDTSVKSDVKELKTLLVDADWSIAGSNHKAILINAEKNIIAFPADERYYVYSYADADGFTEKATVRLGSGYWGGNLRGLFINDALYVLSESGIVVLDLAGFSTLAKLNYE